MGSDFLIAPSESRDGDRACLCRPTAVGELVRLRCAVL